MARSVLSIASVVAGNLAGGLLWIGCNAILAGLYPETLGGAARVENLQLLLLMLFYSVVISLAAGYVTAYLAGRREVHHALAAGLVQLALGAAFQAANWTLLPVWYHAAFLLLLLPGALGGGRLRVLQRQREAELAF
jgi:hypothetical protein